MQTRLREAEPDARSVLRRRAVVAAATIASTASAQLGSYNPNPGPQGTFAIRGGRVVTVSGAEIPNGTVVISGGKITAVGANVTVPANAQVIDATGLHGLSRHDRDRLERRPLRDRPGRGRDRRHLRSRIVQSECAGVLRHRSAQRAHRRGARRRHHDGRVASDRRHSLRNGRADESRRRHAAENGGRSSLRVGDRASALGIRRSRVRARRRGAAGRSDRRQSRASTADGFVAHDASRRRSVRQGAGGLRQGQVDSASGARCRPRRVAPGAERSDAGDLPRRPRHTTFATPSRSPRRCTSSRSSSADRKRRRSRRS